MLQLPLQSLILSLISAANPENDLKWGKMQLYKDWQQREETMGVRDAIKTTSKPI